MLEERKARKKAGPGPKRGSRAKKSLNNREKKALADQRIELIHGMICDREWKGRESEKVFAARWSKESGEAVAVKTVHNLAVQAFRVHRLHFSNDEEIRTRLLHEIEVIALRSMKNQRYERRKVKGGEPGQTELVGVPDPQYGAALKAYELIGKEVGLFEARHRMTVEDAFAQRMAAIEARFGKEQAAEIFRVIAESSAEVDEAGTDPIVH